MVNKWKEYNGPDEDTLYLHSGAARVYEQESVEVYVCPNEAGLRVEVEDAEAHASVYMDREAAERLRRFLNEKLGE